MFWTPDQKVDYVMKVVKKMFRHLKLTDEQAESFVEQTGLTVYEFVAELDKEVDDG